MDKKAHRPAEFEEVAGVTIELSDGALREVLQPPTLPPRPAGNPTERQLSKRDAEMSKGAERVKAHEDRLKQFPPPVKNTRERQAEGQSMPVLRPGDGGRLTMAQHLRESGHLVG
jgi:hypothetical protein